MITKTNQISANHPFIFHPPDPSLNLTEYISQRGHLFHDDKVNTFISLPKTEMNQYISFCFNSAHIAPLIVVSPCHTSHHFHHSSPIHHPIPVSSFWTHLSIFFAPPCRNKMQVTYTFFSPPAVAVLAGATTKCVPVQPKSDWLTTCCYGRSLENPLFPTPKLPSLSSYPHPLQHPSALPYFPDGSGQAIHGCKLQ